MDFVKRERAKGGLSDEHCLPIWTPGLLLSFTVILTATIKT